MLLGEAKDVVREHFGRLGLNTTMLTLGLTEGRRMIEREANFWWMRGTYDASAVINQQDYSIQSGGDFDIANFKDARYLLVKKASDVNWLPVDLGVVDHEELDQMYDEDDFGVPDFALIDNTTLKLYPPLPDFAYDLRLYFYQWTDNPTLNTDTDDLLKNYGMAVCCGAIIWGFEMQLKDLQGAMYWRGQLYGKNGYIYNLKRENLKRDWKDRIMLTPHDGAGRLNRRSLTNLNIYCR